MLLPIRLFLNTTVGYWLIFIFEQLKLSFFYYCLNEAWLEILSPFQLCVPDRVQQVDIKITPLSATFDNLQQSLLATCMTLEHQSALLPLWKSFTEVFLYLFALAVQVESLRNSTRQLSSKHHDEHPRILCREECVNIWSNRLHGEGMLVVLLSFEIWPKSELCLEVVQLDSCHSWVMQ